MSPLILFGTDMLYSNQEFTVFLCDIFLLFRLLENQKADAEASVKKLTSELQTLQKTVEMFQLIHQGVYFFVTCEFRLFGSVSFLIVLSIYCCSIIRLTL
jgi:hypothetical protein